MIKKTFHRRQKVLQCVKYDGSSGNARSFQSASAHFRVWFDWRHTDDTACLLDQAILAD